MTYTDKNIIIRNVPDRVRRELRAASAMEGRPMKDLLIKIITNRLRIIEEREKNE